MDTIGWLSSYGVSWENRGQITSSIFLSQFIKEGRMSNNGHFLIEALLEDFRISNEDFLFLVYHWMTEAYGLYAEEKLQSNKNQLDINGYEDICREGMDFPDFLIDLCSVYINYNYALYGYSFSKEEWLAGFKNFSWYKPETKNPY
jgi:hypothetical protein